METKKMTLAEAQEFVKNTKYLVWSEDESRLLQEKLFKIGCEWVDSVKRVKHTEHPFLYVNEKMKLSYSYRGIYMCFEESKKRYMPTEDILNIELEQSKPKFDPKTLQPFDKILIKDGGVWRCNYFSHIDENNGNYPIICVGSCWRSCIPYNDETKHLLGTKNEAPDFYRLD